MNNADGKESWCAQLDFESSSRRGCGDSCGERGSDHVEGRREARKKKGRKERERILVVDSGTTTIPIS